MPWPMLDEVRRFIRRERLLQPGEAVLVAVSGGLDSMALLHALQRLGHPCRVLHVDHGLRGAGSEADCAFVQGHCRALGIPFRSARVDAAAHARATRASVQMAARALRYAFFEGAAREASAKVALAHHADDAVETLLMGLMRGTGADGWGGIPPRTGPFVRPLLAVHREAIAAYAREHGIAFREDPSNDAPKYLRNRIRHEVLPLLEAIRPGAARAMARSIALLRELDRRARPGLAAEAGALAAEGDGQRARIPEQALSASGTPRLLLHRLLGGKGFHPDAMERMLDALAEGRTGAQFSAGGWRVAVDRDALLIGPEGGAPEEVVIEADAPAPEGGPFRWEWERGPGLAPPAGMHEALLDADRLRFPLLLRPWRPGDRMRPIGLGGSKLISDILTDAKVPGPEKERACVLLSGSEIAWLVGHRIGEGCQATPATRRALRVRTA